MKKCVRRYTRIRPLLVGAAFAVLFGLSTAARAQFGTESIFYTVTTLASFNGANGAVPVGGVARDAQGDLFGVTYQGGDLSLNGGSGDGLAYEIAAGSNNITTLARFEGYNGANPDGGVIIDSSGNLYGTALNGSATLYNQGAGYGNVFEIAAGSNTVTQLNTFYGYNNTGVNPQGALVRDSSGNLYGTTLYSGSSNNTGVGISGFGSLYKIDAVTGVVTTLANFDGTNGSYPSGGLTIDSSGNLYGVASSGGSDGNGTVFELAAGSSTISVLHTFTGGSDGSGPNGGLAMDASGNLYGTTISGGQFGTNPSGDGTVFKIAAGTGAFSTVAAFSGTNGSRPSSRLTIDASGNIYGSTAKGGYNNTGAVFGIAAGTHTINLMASFDGGTYGTAPSNLVLDTANKVAYGTTQGGVNNDGTVFAMSLVGTVYFSPLPPTLLEYIDSSTKRYSFSDVPGNAWTAPSLDGGTSYTYAASGTSLFTSIAAFPTGFGGPFTVAANGQTLGQFYAGQSLDFTHFFAGGVSSFVLSGIDPTADAAKNGGVPLQLTFNTATASFTVVSMSPQGSAAAPEPGALTLLLSAAFAGAGALSAQTLFRRRAARAVPAIGAAPRSRAMLPGSGSASLEPTESTVRRSVVGR